jgi:hypothetical protein
MVKCFNQCLVSILTLLVAGRDPFAQNGNVYGAPFLGQPGDGTTAAENFVVRVSSNYKYCHEFSSAIGVIFTSAMIRPS